MGVEGAVLVCDQHNALECVDVDQESKLRRDAFFFPIQRKMPRQTCGSAGNRQTVVTWQAQSISHEVVKLLAKPSVTAIDGSRVDTTGIECNPTLKNTISRSVHRDFLNLSQNKSVGQSSDKSVPFQ